MLKYLFFFVSKKNNLDAGWVHHLKARGKHFVIIIRDTFDEFEATQNLRFGCVVPWRDRANSWWIEHEDCQCFRVIGSPFPRWRERGTWCTAFVVRPIVSLPCTRTHIACQCRICHDPSCGILQPVKQNKSFKKSSNTHRRINKASIIQNNISLMFPHRIWFRFQMSIKLIIMRLWIRSDDCWLCADT